MTEVALQEVNSLVFSVHLASGEHVGNLKKIGQVWKFKAIGVDAHGAVLPGGGPLTLSHNVTVDAPDAQALGRLLGPLQR
ncbi:hypothetical protein [Rhodoferax aquaticus]|uniref:Uncharacterized protein n=1 Tax=Rhodoferax aquaticus TaxID=2527691 RepID=A0A515EJZ2_9BURK|nr:hypothetical protein [Rhodoferax aquaticus]QDL52995.1 hypothetical protein EXZ61_01760 [Rhodoferax aquaticus]